MRFDLITDAEQDALNEAAYAEAAVMLRRAVADFPGYDLDDVRRYCSDVLAADLAACAADIKRAQRARATKQDRRNADWARRMSERLARCQFYIYDVEV